MKNKLFYTQPNTDLLELRSEGLICESITIIFGDPGEAGGDLGLGDDENNYGSF